MADSSKGIVKATRPLTVGQLAWTLAQLRPDQTVYVDMCDACGSMVLSFEGPETECPTCTMKITVRPMIVRI